MNIKISTSEYPKIISFYINDWLSGSQIASLFNVEKKTIIRILKKCGIKIRSKNDCMRGHYLNKSFFEVIDTEEKAYWLGFIIADGCITDRNRIVIALNIIDKNHLLKFLKSLNKDGIVRTYIKPREIAVVSLRSNEIVDSLSKYGVVPRKSSKTYFPKQIPKRLQRHFIRGVFDGDGCISITKDRNYYFDIAGTKELLLFIGKILKKECGLNKICLYKHTGYSTYKLAYTGNLQVPRILDCLYKDSDIYLDRKYNKYLTILNEER